MKKKLVWLLLSGLMVAALLVASCAPGATKEKEAAPAKEKAAPAKEEVVGEEGEPGTFLGPFKVGETAQTDRLAVTITELYLADSYEYYSASTQKMISRDSGPGTTYLFANIMVKNLDSARSYQLPLAGDTSGTMPIVIRGGYAGGSHHTGGYFGTDSFPRGMPWLAPGEEAGGKVIFIIPEGQTGHWVEYRLQIDPAIWARWLLE